MAGHRCAGTMLVAQYTTGVSLLFQRPPVILAPVPLRSLSAYVGASTAIRHTVTVTRMRRSDSSSLDHSGAAGLPGDFDIDIGGAGRCRWFCDCFGMDMTASFKTLV